MKQTRMSFLPRWVHRCWACVAGYFWKPCPLCGRYSGGHEWKERGGLSATVDWPGFTQAGQLQRGMGICPACTRDGLGDPKWADHV